MFSYTSSVFFCLGLCLVFSHVQAGVKSPYRKSDDLTSGEKVDHSGEFRDYSRSSLDQIKENITQMSIEFKSLKEMLDRHVKHVNHTLENRCHYDNDLGHYPADRGPSGGSNPSGVYYPGGSGTGPSGGGSRPGRPSSRPAAFSRPPIVREADEFDYAICKLRPNNKAASNVTGVVLLQQKKNSPTLYVIIRAVGFDVSGHGGHGDHEKSGPLTDPQKPERLQDIGQAREDFSQQLSKIGKNQKVIVDGHSHAFRVHERPDIAGGCGGSGPVYNPQKLRGVEPLGDFGNIQCDDDGASYMVITEETASLRGQYSIVGKPLVIHRNAGDASLTSDENDCLSCCIIEKIPSSLYNTYQFPKDPAGDQTSSSCAYSSQTHSHFVSGYNRHHHHHGSGVHPGGQGGRGSGGNPGGSGSGGYPGGSGSGGYPGGSGSGGYPGGSGSGGYPGGSGSGGYPGGSGSGGYPGGSGSGGYPGGSGSGGYPGGSGGYRPGYGGTRPGSGRPGGHGSHQPINQGGHDVGADHHFDDDDHQVSQQKH